MYISVQGRTAFGLKVVPVKEVTAILSFMFVINWNSLDNGVREQVDPGRLAG